MWTTANERAYIDCLLRGQFLTGNVPVEKVLRNYIKGARRREKNGTFGAVDPKIVIGYAEEALKRLEGTR